MAAAANHITEGAGQHEQGGKVITKSYKHTPRMCLNGLQKSTAVTMRIIQAHQMSFLLVSTNKWPVNLHVAFSKKHILDCFEDD